MFWCFIFVSMLTFYYQNTRGLRTKTNDLYGNVLQCSYDVIVFSETWLNSNIFDNELFDSRYVVYRRDRQMVGKESKLIGGGVLIAVSRKLQSNRLMQYESECEDIWVSVSVDIEGVSKKLHICAVYIPSPPKFDTVKRFLDNTCNVINLVGDVVVMGDMNLGDIEWTNALDGWHTLPSNYHNAMENALIDFMHINNLRQYNNIRNQNDRILDIVLSNVCYGKVAPPLDLLSRLDLHHPPILYTIDDVGPTMLRSRPYTNYNFFKADYDIIVGELMNIDWSFEFLGCSTTDQMVSVFYGITRGLIERCVPKCKKRKSTHPSWFTVALIKMLKEKEKLRRRHRKFNNPRDQIEFELVRDRCNKYLNNCYINYKRKIESKISQNCKTFWKFVNNKRMNNTSIPSSMNLNNISAENGYDIANLFAKHFSSVFNTSGLISSNNSIGRRECLPGQFSVTVREVFRKLDRLDPDKSAGPDQIPPIFYKRAAAVLAFPLTIIFNHSLARGTFPTEWKKARIVPILKKGDPHCVKNYRPITILSCPSKLLESLVCPIITQYVDKYITPHQHGFRNGRSIQTNLVNFVSDLACEIDKGKQVDTVYTDFSSAFDKVDHYLLLQKLDAFGLNGCLLDWLRSYLSDRYQSVVVKGFESDAYLAQSGVPQGSNMGPLLFISYINDITSCIEHCKYALFADDLKIYKKVETRADVALIQGDLGRIEVWCRSNNMELNSGKCSFVRFTRKLNAIPSVYGIKSQPLEELTEIRDLGVIMDNKLKFTSHIKSVTTKAAQMLGFVKRNSRSFSNRTKIYLFNALVRSQLEYASVVWNPTYAVHSQQLESVQRAFTKHLAFLSQDISHRCPYDQRMKFFKLGSLRDRRKLCDALFLHKCVNGTIKSEEILSRISLSVPYHIPRTPITRLFHPPVGRTNVVGHAPVSRVCCTHNEFNAALPDLDVFFDSLAKYKATIIRFLSVAD